MKTNLELIKDFVTSVSTNYPEKLPALLAVVEKHYNANRKQVDATMSINQDPKCGWAALKQMPGFIPEMMSLK